MKILILLTLLLLFTGCSQTPKMPSPNALQPEIHADEFILGNKEAKNTIVVFSDYQCPYCAEGHKRMKALLNKYNDELRVIYKHMPLSNHRYARPAALYFEAIRRQDPIKAQKFHDTLYNQQRNLSTNGKTFLEAEASALKIDMNQLKKDIEKPELNHRIEVDIKQALHLGIRATPSFIVNGHLIVGAQPLPVFIKILED